MTRLSYVNGQYVPHGEAAIHIEDRGYQFSDGIYEVIAVMQHRFIDGEGHWQRLERSVEALEIPLPMSIRALKHVAITLFRRNRAHSGNLYIQITRGVAKRFHAFPKHSLPALVMTLTPLTFPSLALQQKGIGVITQPDIRWGRRDIKTISLLPNCLAKEQAVRANVKEAWLYEPDGTFTEGSSSNSFIVTNDKIIRTHPLGPRILGGITRETILRFAREAGFKVEEKPFTQHDLATAQEAFLTSTTSKVQPIITIDGKPVGSGTAGPTALKLVDLYNHYLQCA